MKITYEFVHMDTSKTLENFVSQKFETVTHKYPWLLEAHITFEKENYKEGKGKICAIRGVVSGADTFAKTHSETYQGAFKKALREIERQLEKKKYQMKSYA